MKKQPELSFESELIVISRSDFAVLIASTFEANSVTIRKTAVVHAKRAEGGEKITTIVDNQIETNNSASAGDYIITNQTSENEQYIVKPENFNRRYTLKEELEGRNATYFPKLTINALQLTAEILVKLNLPRQFYFIAPWGAKQFAEEGDYIVSNDDFTDIYRVSLSKFLETYKTVVNA